MWFLRWCVKVGMVQLSLCSDILWCGMHIVDRPTQLICISDIYLLYLFICQQTNTKDIAGQSASMHGMTLFGMVQYGMVVYYMVQ